LWPAAFFLAYSFRVGFHEKKSGDFVVAGYGVLHSGFNAVISVAFAVNIECTGWPVHAIVHEALWRRTIGRLIPSETLLVLRALKLADGKRWCGDALSYVKCGPAEFRRDLRVMASYLMAYLYCVLEYMRRHSHLARQK